MRRLALLLVTGSLLAPAARAQTVTLESYSGLFQDKFTDAVIRPFEKANPGITISYFAQPNSAQMLGTVRAQKAAPQIDCVILDVSVSKAGTDENLFDPVTEKNVPNVADLLPVARIAGVAGVGETLDSLVLIYDTQVVKTPPTSWMAMADPSMAGKVGIDAPPNIVGAGLTIALDHDAGGTDYLQSLDRGLDAVKKIAPNVATFDPQPEIYPLVVNGTLAIGPGWNARSQVFSDQSHGRLKAVLPKEGTVLQINTINLVHGGPQTAAAEKFVNYALSAAAQTNFTNAMFYAPTNAKARIAPDIAARTVVGQMDKIVPVDWIAFARVRDRLTQQWRRQIIPLSH